MTVDHDQVIDFTTYHQFVIDSFHDNLLGRVLADVESELENFVVAILLDERRVYVWDGCWGLWGTWQAVVGCGGAAEWKLKSFWLIPVTGDDLSWHEVSGGEMTQTRELVKVSMSREPVTQGEEKSFLCFAECWFVAMHKPLCWVNVCDGKEENISPMTHSSAQQMSEKILLVGWAFRFVACENLFAVDLFTELIQSLCARGRKICLRSVTARSSLRLSTGRTFYDIIGLKRFFQVVSLSNLQREGLTWLARLPWGEGHTRHSKSKPIYDRALCVCSSNTGGVMSSR